MLEIFTVAGTAPEFHGLSFANQLQ